MKTKRHAANIAPKVTTVTDHRWVCRVDCTQDRGANEYFQSLPTRVVKASIGAYREAAPRKESRFGYRFSVRTVGCPHEVIVRYPDDKPRFMCVMDGSTYDLSSGVFSGGAIPVSGQMREIRLVFWPRWAECTLVFMSWLADKPAAVASFEVRELAALPPPALPGEAEAGDGDRREFGMAFEDPCGMGLGMGAASREEWIGRVAAFMRHTGQSLLIYPIAWYHGPQFPSEREPADAFDVAVAPDRRMYGRYTTQPPEWVTPLLDRFHAEGLGFMAEVRFFRLGSLMQKMNIDLEAIKAGADTINNMLWNDQVQSGTMDWTVVYNARNYPEMLKRGVSVFAVKGFPYVYGEKCMADIGGGYPSTIVPTGAIFNPLHPVVQEAILGFTREIGQRYGKHPAFRGVAAGLWSETCLWYGSLKRGYDDVTVSLFQKDTGIAVPVAADAPDRFSKRYEFLTTHCREAWVAWRCRRIRDLLLAVRDALREARADLRLVLVPNPGNVAWAANESGRPGDELLREAGLDLALLVNQPGIELDMGTEGAAGLNEGILPVAATADGVTPTGMCVADSWVESWGKNRMFACDADDPNVKVLGRIGDREADLYRFTCEYPPDGFWYQDQWRISTPFPAGEHFLAPLAGALADADALRITRGGLYPDTAHAEEQRRFALAFGALPRKKFDTVGSITDPVALRTLAHDGCRYVYAVNREYYPVRMMINFTEPAGRVAELGTGIITQVQKSWALDLGPYELRAFRLASNSVPTDFTVTVPAKIRKSLTDDARRVLGDLKAMLKAHHHVPGLDALEAGIRVAVAEGRLAWLRQALGGDGVRKVREALQSVACSPFVREFLVSEVLPSRPEFEGLVLPSCPEDWGFTRRTFADDFCDMHAELGARSPEDTLVFFSCRLEVPETMRLAALLGYDGPVKLWVDGTPRFCDSKGTNPARRDSARVKFTASAGSHEVVVALGSNKGQAWGIFLRFERLDVSKPQRLKGPPAIVLPRVLA